MTKEYFTLPTVLREFIAKRDGTPEQECPQCGKACNHTSNQKQGFALDALKEASDWYEGLKK